MDRRRNGEGGFTVLEAAVAAAIVTIAVGGVLGAVLAVARQTSALDERGRLRMVAEDVLTDLRAMTAYDPVELAAVSGRSQAATVELPSAAGGGPPVRVTVRWAVVADGAGAALATVSATDPRGLNAVAQGKLASEAPAPGSSVQFSTPPPVANDRGAWLPEPAPVMPAARPGVGAP